MRTGVWDKLLSLFKGLAPLCIDLENLAYGKKTGKHKSFKKYYILWEKFVFNHLAK
jgi:hypothetical protein